jgi:hypothetical protein
VASILQLSDVGAWFSGVQAAPFWFALAIVLLDRFDIALPRGDSFGVSGALIVSGLMVSGDWTFVVWALAATLLSHVGRRDGSAKRLVSALLVRSAALCTTLLVSGVVRDEATPGPLSMGLIVLPVVYLLVEIVVAQFSTAVAGNRSFAGLLKGNFTLQAPLVAAQVSAAALTVITYAQMGPWSLVLVVGLLLLIRQSTALLLSITATYRATIEALVEAAEAQDPRRLGHAERTARISRMIGSRIGLPASEVDRVSFCALLHDIGSIAGPTNGLDVAAGGNSARVIEGIEFFSDVVPVLRVCDGESPDEAVEERHLVASMIVALASDIDSVQHPELRGAHQVDACGRLSSRIPAAAKARVVSAAIELGYRIPAVN